MSLLSNIRAGSSPPRASAGQAPALAATARQALKVVMVYQDSLTRAWASDLWHRVGASLSDETALLQSWRIGDLGRHEVLPQAVEAASVADILLVSMRALPEPPPELSLWAEHWLAKRGVLAGTLVALLGTTAEPPVEPLPAQRYLESLARRAKVDFMPRQRALPAGGLPLTVPAPGQGQ